MAAGTSSTCTGDSLVVVDQGTVTILRRLEWPGHSSRWPWMATTQSPVLTMPSAFAFSKAFWITESVPTKEAVNMETTPRTHCSWRTVLSLAEMARMVALGRYLAMTLAVWPVSVRAMMRGQPESIVAFTAEEQMDSTGVMPLNFSSVVWHKLWYKDSYSTTFSASSQMRRMMVTASIGKAPAAVSPESMTQSVPSSTAFATSLASARVGRGRAVVDSSICVAVTTGLPTMLHLEIIIFCAKNTFSGGISMPKSPRATMMASLASTIASKFFRPSSFSILEVILMDRPRKPSVSRMSCTSSALCTKEAATKSTPWGMPKLTRSSMSFSCNTGSSTFTPGKLQFFRSPSLQLFMTSVMTQSAPHSLTFSDREPSAIKMVLPGLTEVGNLS
mmetsp:Transcript_83269/g.268431  ORF Transcript_83269/g.268431 Transcript_83269/m.268431 type:complete len:389 (-) Transcript_83269:168-1334(-)